MNRDEQISAAQLAILTRYNLLADCSDLDEDVLKRIGKGLPNVDDGTDPTFASWCDRVVGKGVRLPIARFDYHIAGQTRLSSLRDGYGLAQGILGLEKEQQTSARNYRKEIRRLEADLNGRFLASQSPAASESVALDDFSRSLRDWYGETAHSLRRILWDIKEVEGQFFGHQGPSNKDYRSLLIDTILPKLNRLDGLGFDVKVELHDLPHMQPPAQSIMIYESRVTTIDEYSRKDFTFVVEDVQADILEIAERWPEQTGFAVTSSESKPKLNCHVSVSVEAAHPVDEDEFFHLSCFLQKLFSALAKSGDHVARSILREKVLLCLLLSWTAPCMPARERAEDRRLNETLYGNLTSFNPAHSQTTSDLPAGQIVEHLFSIMQEYLRP
ncbi:hypothetical protein [Pseudomonas frederiksbergensis]|uniref:hypothetical protein n=1 Tax=Pseudomonas frederiksbergensis TaxID=104087 RepID=UPI003D9964E4